MDILYIIRTFVRNLIAPKIIKIVKRKNETFSEALVRSLPIGVAYKFIKGE